MTVTLVCDQEFEHADVAKSKMGEGKGDRSGESGKEPAMDIFFLSSIDKQPFFCFCTFILCPLLGFVR